MMRACSLLANGNGDGRLNKRAAAVVVHRNGADGLMDHDAQAQSGKPLSEPN
jgi:hypothetical protein